MSCQFVLCFEKCRIIAQSLEHVYYNEHETRKGREFDILPIFGMCSVYLQRTRFALPLFFLWLFTNWRQNSNWQIHCIQYSKSWKYGSIFHFHSCSFWQNKISPKELYYLCKFYHKKDLPFTISKFKRSYLIFFVDSRPRADESS